MLIITNGDIYAIVKNDSKVLTEHMSPNVKLCTHSISGSIFNDTIPPKLGEDFLDESIFTDAADSTILDVENQVVHLYGNAIVKYGDMVLEAGYISFSFGTNIATAHGIPDSTGKMVQIPEFFDGDQVVEQAYLEFNFKTKAGISKGTYTSDGGAFILGEVSKIQPNKWVHIRNGKFTTCDADNPHYHFHLTKAIAIPEDKIVTGPVYLKVRKVPLPLALPFGFFPNKNESTHGVIIPGYGDGGDLGFFLQKGGYYIPINDHWDTKFLFDIYSRGSWTASNRTNYKKRYGYNGFFDVTNSNFKRGIEELNNETIEKSFFIKWRHYQDTKARPNTTFNADVEFGSSNSFTNNLSSSQDDFLQGTFNSSINWTKTFVGGKVPGNFSISAREVQNSVTRNYRITLPSMSLSSGSDLSFLVNEDKYLSDKWYNKVKYTFRSDFEYFFDATESEMRIDNLDNLLGNAKSGMRSRIDLSSNKKIFNKLVSVTPRVNYTEYWSIKRYEESILTETRLIVDEDTVNTFFRTGDWSMGLSLNTKFYGMFKFRNSKKINAIRHVLTPNISFNYTPESVRSVEYGVDENGNSLSFNPWQMSSFRANDIRERGGVRISLQNNLEAKVRDKSKVKPTWKKVKLIDNFNISSGYNFIADSLKMDPVGMNYSTTILKKFNIYGGAGFDPYERNENGVRIDQYLFDSQNKLLRLTSANVSASWNFRSKNNKGGKNTDNISEDDLEYVNNNSGNFVDFTVPWSLNLTYSVDLFKVYDQSIQADTNRVTSSILFSGDFALFDRWMISFNSGYDLVNKDFTTTSIDLYWDMHCWEMKFHWIPIGIRKSYTVQLNIKSSLLKDLKLQKRDTYGDREFF